MRPILVSGLTNIETTLKIDGFPLAYNPVNYPFFGVHSSTSGVGINIAKALTSLGSECTCVSVIGKDPEGMRVVSDLSASGIQTEYVLTLIEETPASVILYDAAGKRQIHVDLKDLQETPYPEKKFQAALKGAAMAAMCNINYNRALLPLVKAAGIPVATDVHVLTDIHDAYNADFMQAASILFLSNEGIAGREYSFIRELYHTYQTPVIVIGMGEDGALLLQGDEDSLEHIPAAEPDRIVNTIGAGDALFSAFIYFHSAGDDARTALEKAVIFAACKIGSKGASDGFVHASEVEKRYATHCS